MKGDLLEELYGRYYNEVYLYAYSLCKNHHTAQELCSDTFFKALISCDGEMASIKYWLLRVCKNCYIDLWRKAQKRNAPLIEEMVPAEDGDPLEHILQKETQRSLYKAVLQLPESNREAILLFYFQGLSGQEIAAITGRTPGAVRTLLYRAKIQLRDLLKEEIL